MLGMFVQKLEERLDMEMNKRLSRMGYEDDYPWMDREREQLMDEILNRLFAEIKK